MSTVKDLKVKVVNTLNILSGQNITETKLYQSILTADFAQKRCLIITSQVVSAIFYNFGKSFQTMKIFKWLKIIFDELKIIENNDDLKKYMYIKKILSNTRKTLSLEEIADRVKNTYFLAYDYADAWSKYIGDDKSNCEEVAKSIQPIELFILTAITTLPIACQISQKPFEYYANMDFITLMNVLNSTDYIILIKFIYCGFSESDKKDINRDTFMQYRLFDNWVNKEESEESSYVLNPRDIDKMFGKIIKVSEKSKYEKLKQIYKK